MDVKATNENVFLKLTFVGYLMLHGDITFDQSHGDVFPWPAPNREKTNIRKFSVFHIT